MTPDSGEEDTVGGAGEHGTAPVLRALEQAGFPVRAFTGEQRAVFAALTPQELELILDLKARLDVVEPEVQAHTVVAGAALF
ncbi:aroma-sacti cluster domain-containing protein [Streptomyces sp. NPDC091209]|uniref:aroma-sacti cluster domain-containing protein n=1 Tax=Streptomyces sp. NPDC091209 TaxID=3365974 RepID=UPI003815FD17